MYGKRIRESRIDKGLTQTQLAQLISTTQSTIGKYEREELQPNIEAIIDLCHALGVSADYLLGLEDETGTKTYISNSFNNFTNSGNIKF